MAGLNSSGLPHKRKLVSQEVIDEIFNNSAYKAEKELQEATWVLSKTLGTDNLKLHTFDESRVVYKNHDSNTFYHAAYKVGPQKVLFENIEELVVDEKSKQQKRRSLIGSMLEAVYNEDKTVANNIFGQYLKLIEWKKEKDELKSFKEKKKKSADKERLTPPSKAEAEKDKKESKKEKFLKMIGMAKKNKDKKNESLLILAKNVLEYVEFVINGPDLDRTSIRKDEKGNLVSIEVPNAQLRNEAKILSFNWKQIGNGLKTQREHALNICNDVDFCKYVGELRDKNAESDNRGFEETVQSLVAKWPTVLYATQDELASIVKESLNNIGEDNYDDDVCNFISEAILRNAFETYRDRVNKVLAFAKTNLPENCEDPYAYFQDVVMNLYHSVDNQFNLQKKVFEDLYEALVGVYRTAERRADENLKNEVSRYLEELHSIISEEARPDIQLAEDVANFLISFVETNLEGGMWSVSNSPHITMSGDHPAMADKARKPYSPSTDFSGNYGDGSPQIGADDMNYKGGKNSSKAAWTHEGGNEIFPHLNNPYVPKSFDFTMKNEKGVDKDDSGVVSWQSNDTWPNLQNPYAPKSETPSSYKMKNGPETDLVVDK